MWMLGVPHDLVPRNWAITVCAKCNKADLAGWLQLSAASFDDIWNNEQNAVYDDYDAITNTLRLASASH